MSTDLTFEEVAETVDENGLIEGLDPKDIVPMKRVTIANLSGRSSRKLKRANTIHLKGICPKCCKEGMKFKKDIPILGPKGGIIGYDHNKWVCKGCGGRFTRKEFKYYKYD